MNYYQELTILPDPEISSYFIWSKLFTQLHIALADVRNKHDSDSIGISFPDYHFDSKNGKSSKLGSKLRVFAPSQEALAKLDLSKWLERLTDYVHIRSIKEVGNKATSYVSVHRYRFKPIELQAQTLAEKLSISYTEAMTAVAKRKPEMELPFIRMRSQTNNSNYRLKVLQLPCEKPKSGFFNVYGMNGMQDTVTVPHW